jgi:hypothetical protein
LRHLTELIKDENHRLKTAVELASMINPLPFAYEYFRSVKYIGKEKTDPKDWNVLTELGQAVINKIVERIEIEAKEEILEERYPQNSSSLYYAWLTEKPESIKAYLRERFAKNPKHAEDFIMSFRKQTYDVNDTAIFWKFDFIVSAIEELYPDMELLSLDYYTKDSHYHTETKEEYLRYFVSIVKKILTPHTQIN